MLLNIFILILGLFFTLLLTWSFKNLPHDGWQIIASIPTEKVDSSEWKGVALTFYGLFVALSVIISALLFFTMMGSLGIGSLKTGIFSICVIVSCLLFSKTLARVIERKQNTLTIGGASFAAIIAVPLFVLSINWLSRGSSPDLGLPVIPTLAALAIAYTIGEGVGRLACISFGCCYGPKLTECNPTLQRIFARRHFLFSGATKKISYAGASELTPVIPIQAVTSTLYVSTGVLALYLWLSNLQSLSLLMCILITQGWRFASEFLRADYRGQLRVSVYQIMALVAIVYSLLFVWILPAEPETKIDLAKGLQSCLEPLVIIVVQFLAVAVFLFTGVSSVIGSTITFFIHKDRV